MVHPTESRNPQKPAIYRVLVNSETMRNYGFVPAAHFDRL